MSTSEWYLFHNPCFHRIRKFLCDLQMQEIGTTIFSTEGNRRRTNTLITLWSRMSDTQLGRQLGFSWTKQKCKQMELSECEWNSTPRPLNALYSWGFTCTIIIFLLSSESLNSEFLLKQIALAFLKSSKIYSCFFFQINKLWLSICILLHSFA